MESEGEIKNFIRVWITVLASLYYCFKIGKVFPGGKTRFFAISPILCLFLYLPFTLHSIHLGATTSFFIGWLSTFKLLLFAFGKGPLSPPDQKPISLLRFSLLASLPINIQSPNSHQKAPQKRSKSAFYYAVQVLIAGFLVKAYKYKDYAPPKLLMLLYCLHMYLALEVLLAAARAVARGVARVELQPPFDKPYLSASLQDFWGRRWNLIVSTILRQAVYDPVKSLGSRWMGREWAMLPAVIATFFVSGVMHEMILYNIGRMRPTGEIMCFFLIHGACLALEMVAKKALLGKLELPRIVSAPLVLLFVMGTSLWLFMPPSLRCKADDMVRTETASFFEFVKSTFGITTSSRV